VGARVEVRAGGRTQVRERQCGGSYLSSHDPRLHFGLSHHLRADVTVRWPDGSVEEYGAVEANRILVIRQGPG